MPIERIDERQDRERAKAVELAVGQIEKQFGKGSIMRLGQKGAIQPIDFIPTGAISIDYALGVGGVPRGRVIEIFGPESSGKTTLALQIIAEGQKLGGMAAFVDAEHALDALYAQKLGVDIDNLLVSQPDNGEQALEIVEVLIRSNGVDVVVVDSVAALLPKAEIEGEMGDAQMGLQARLMSQALRKLTATISRSQTVVIFINQIRMKIGVMFGNPETTTGGNALKFYASVRMDIRRIGALKEGDNIIGGRTRVKVVKNKMAPPFKEAEFDILYGTGISRDGEIVDLGSEIGVVEKSGAWYSYGGERIGQGREAAKQFLKEHPETASDIMGKVMDKTAIKRLFSLNYLNDEDFARNWARSRVQDSGYGPRRIEQELRSKDIEPSIVRDAVREAFAPLDEATLAKRVLTKRFKSANLKEPTALRRAASFLQRRGYSSKVIFDLLRYPIEDD